MHNDNNHVLEKYNKPEHEGHSVLLLLHGVFHLGVVTVSELDGFFFFFLMPQFLQPDPEMEISLQSARCESYKLTQAL